LTKNPNPSPLHAKRWVIFVAIPGILILLALGSWQVQRMMWKNDTNAFRQARAQSEAIALPADVEDIDAMQFRPVWLEGHFQHEKELFLAARSYRSNPGYHVITPFERTDGSVVLVNRGWIPLDRRDPASRAEGQIEGMVRIEGLLNTSVEPGWMTPDNVPDENFWYWLDMPSLSAQAGIAARDYLVDAGPATNPGGYPIGGQTILELRNSHVQYVVTWFAMALTLGVITILMLRGARRRAQQSGADTDS
jgi:surfeit locus 1 family protein